MRQALEKWLNKFHQSFSIDTAHSLCNNLGLDGEKVDECLGFVYQFEKGNINEADFTVGLGVLTGKKPEEMAKVLKGMKAGPPTTVEDFINSKLSELSTRYNLQLPKWQLVPSEIAAYDWDTKVIEIPNFLTDAWPEAKGSLISHLRHEFCHYKQDMEGRGNLPEYELEAECFKFEAERSEPKKD